LSNKESLVEAAQCMYFSDRGRPFSIERVERDARRVIEAHKAEQCLIVIDYLQRIVPVANTGSDYARMNAVIGEVSTLAGKLKSPVIAISEVNRASYGAKSMSAAKESGRIEYAADILGLLLKEKGSGDYPRKVALHILKNRNGERATIKYHIWLGASEFEELEKLAFKDDDECAD
jgi:replicative DNA helicase